MKSDSVDEVKKLTCGLIMPISEIDGCSAEHWAEVKSIVTEAVASISEYKFSVDLVSDQEDAGVIQKRIVQNIYNSDVVICDVSCKNPNVMFELGMRLAFDKPTLIIKDDRTDYSFDTSVIEHLNYPRDLRFQKMVSFKQRLADKVCATYRASQADSSHSFLSSFGTFKVAALAQTEATPDQVMLDMLADISRDISRLRKGSGPYSNDGVKSISKYLAVGKALKWIDEVSPDTNFRNLLGQEDFYRSVEVNLPSDHDFKSKDDLIDTVDTYVLAMETSKN